MSSYLVSRGYEVVNFGTGTCDSVFFPEGRYRERASALHIEGVMAFPGGTGRRQGDDWGCSGFLYASQPVRKATLNLEKLGKIYRKETCKK